MTNKENQECVQLERQCFLRSPIATCFTDASGRIIHANAPFWSMVNLAADNSRKRNMLSIWPPNVRKIFQSIFPLEKPHLEFCFNLPNGHSLLSYTVGVDQISDGKNSQQFLWHFIPVKNLSLDEETMIPMMLQKVHHFEGALLLLDIEGKIEYCNKVCSQHWLFKKGRMISRTLQQICKKAFYPAIAELWRRAQTGQWCRQTMSFEFPSGELKWIDCIFSPLTFSNGRTMVVAFFHDISVEKNMQHEAEVARKAYFELLQKVDVGIVVVGRDRFLYANEAAEKVVGQPLAPGSWGLPPQLQKYPENYRLWQNAQRRLRGQRLPEKYEHQIVLADGTTRDLAVTSRLVEVDGQSHVVASMVDITDFKKNERLLQQRADELQILNKISEVCNQTLTLDSILNDALNSIMKFVGATFGVVYLHDEKEKTFHATKARGLSAEKLSMLFPPDEEILLTKNAFQQKRPFYATEASAMASFPMLARLGITSFLVIPISHKGKILGTINLGTRGKRCMRVFSEDVLMAIGKQMGLAIENARLLQAREEEILRYRKTEAALRESQAKYQILAEAAHDMIYVIGTDDRILYANKFAASQFGLEVDQLIGKKRQELFPGEIAERQRKAIEMVIKTAKPFYSEEETPFGDQVLWISTWLVPIYDDAGKVQQILGVSRDITAAKKTELALQASERRFRDIIERSLDGYYFIDVNGRIMNLSPSFQEISAFSPKEMVGRELSSLLDAQTNKRAKKIIAKVMSGKNIKWGEIFVASAKGDRRWYGFNARRVMDKGIVIGMEGFVKDITRQKMVAEALQRSEAKYRALFDSIPYEVFAMDTAGNYTGANRLFIQNWGEIIGKNAVKLGQKQQIHNIFAAMCKRVLKNQLPLKEFIKMDSESRPIYYSCIMSPVLTDKNEMIGLVGINIDITEQTLAHEHLKIISKRLVQVQEEERARIAREIHDSLGQYLTALQLEISAALQNCHGESSQRLLEAQQTIKQSLNIASSLCYTLRPSLLDDFGLVAALKDHFREFQNKWQIPINFQTVDISDRLSKDQETALFRITQEALTNILKHAQAHHIKVRLIMNQNKVLLTISDDGRGFYYQQLQKQLNHSGFGLITMKERAELLGGRFYVDSAENKGTTISVEMPINEGAKA